MEKTGSPKRRGGGWSKKSPDVGSHFQSPILPFPHPHPGQSVVTAILQNLQGPLLFSRSSARLSPRSIHSVPKSTGRKGRGGKGEPGAPGPRPPRPHRGPRRGDQPPVSLGGAAHRDGGRAGRGRAEQACPRGFLGPAPPPRSQRVKRGNKGGPGSGPHPWQHSEAKTDTAGDSTLPQHTSPDLHPPPPFSHLRLSFPTPPPSVSPFTPCHSPPHRPAAVPPSSSSPATAAAAVCSVLIGARDWRREIGAI